MDSNKSLLESLRALTPSFKYEAEDAEDISLRDAAELGRDEEDEESLESQELSDEEHEEHEDEEENGEDLDDDGDEDNTHALVKMKRAFDSSEEEMRHAIVMFARILVDTDADIDTIKQFIDDVDLVDEDEDAGLEEEPEDEEGDFEDEDDMYGPEDDYETEEPEDDEEPNESVSDEEDEFQEFKNELYESLADVEIYESDRDSYFTNEAAIADDYDLLDMLE